MAGPTAENNPNAFVGRVTLSAYEPYPILTGTNYSSMPPANGAIVRWVQPQPVSVKNIVMQNTMAAGVPAATSAASAGSEAYTYGYSAFIYSRQDYVGNSSNLSPVVSGSFGLTATMTYTSTSQMFGMSWVTDASGGTSNLTTTSSDGAWSNYANGPRVFSIPFVAVLPAGEYWVAFQHSSTTATSNSNVTLISMSQLLIAAQQTVNAGYLGQSTTNASVSGGNQNVGIMAGVPSFTTTFALSTIGTGARAPWFALSNA